MFSEPLAKPSRQFLRLAAATVADFIKPCQWQRDGLSFVERQIIDWCVKLARSRSPPCHSASQRPKPPLVFPARTSPPFRWRPLSFCGSARPVRATLEFRDKLNAGSGQPGDSNAPVIAFALADRHGAVWRNPTGICATAVFIPMVFQGLLGG
jgi:hypothetical protein